MLYTVNRGIVTWMVEIGDIVNDVARIQLERFKDDLVEECKLYAGDSFLILLYVPPNYFYNRWMEWVSNN